jgi:ribosomal protein S6--L-glutamate ligase
MDLKVAGVDIIRSSKGPLLLEVNSSPGLEELKVLLIKISLVK